VSAAGLVYSNESSDRVVPKLWGRLDGARPSHCAPRQLMAPGEAFSELQGVTENALREAFEAALLEQQSRSMHADAAAPAPLQVP
jgi:hypothetical protein